MCHWLPIGPTCSMAGAV